MVRIDGFVVSIPNGFGIMGKKVKFGNFDKNQKGSQLDVLGNNKWNINNFWKVFHESQNLYLHNPGNNFFLKQKLRSMKYRFEELSEKDNQIHWSILLGEATFILKNTVKWICILSPLKCKKWQNNLAQCQVLWFEKPKPKGTCTSRICWFFFLRLPLIMKHLL